MNETLNLYFPNGGLIFTKEAQITPKQSALQTSILFTSLSEIEMQTFKNTISFEEAETAEFLIDSPNSEFEYSGYYTLYNHNETSLQFVFVRYLTSK